MTKNDLIRKLTDYILLNAGSVTSPGLYNGKAGLSLALFEAARYLEDDYIEDQAFQFFQECLLSQTRDLGFENGMGGIGWALLYLVDTKLANADFDEMFESQYEKIMASFDQIESKPHDLLRARNMICFLSAIIKHKPNDQRIARFVQALFEAIEVYLSVHFFDLTDIHYIDNKANLLNVFESYLRLVHYARYPAVSHSVLNDYATLYRSGKLASSYFIGYYMGEILDRDSSKGFEDVIAGNQKNFFATLCVHALSLRERIDLSQIRHKEPVSDIHLLPRWDGKVDTFLTENRLSRSIPSHLLWAGYQSGISRYLIYNVNNNAILL